MLRIALTVCSLLLLAAHGVRIGSDGVAIFWLLALGLIVVPWRWNHLALAGLLGFGALLWADITGHLVQQRFLAGAPWLRLAAILGSVLLACLLAAGANLKQALRSRTTDALAPGLAFLLTIAILTVARQKSSLELLLADRFFPGGGWVAILLLGIYAAFIVSKMLDIRVTARWRRIIWTLFSAVFFLQLLLGLAGLERFLMTGSLHLPVPALIAAAPLFRGDGLFMITLFGVTVLLIGPAWCSYLCYIGAWDNLAAATQRHAAPLPTWTRPVRRLICLGVLGLALLLGAIGFSPALAALLAAAFGLVGVGMMVLWSRRTGTMTHCIAYCPMGLLADLFGRINPWRIVIDDGCSQCGRCTRICRYQALTPMDLTRQRAGFTCTLCGDCLAACRGSLLHYRFPGLSDATARVAFLVVAVSLHAVFIGVARL